MMKFFTEMTTVTMWVLIALGILSLLYKNFWCRYLCPYGALAGLLSRLQPVQSQTERGEVHALPRLHDALSRRRSTWKARPSSSPRNASAA